MTNAFSLGWMFNELGKQTICPAKPNRVYGVNEVYMDLPGTHDDGVLRLIKSAHYCESCGVFIGRWMTCGCVKTWCSKCAREEGKGTSP